MNKSLLLLMALLLSAVTGWADVVVDAANFPDEVFRGYVSQSFDNAPHDGVLSDDEIAAAVEVSVQDKGVTTLQGVENFTALVSLTVSGNNLGDIDVTRNKALVTLECARCQLSSLDLSGNPALSQLDCSGNQLSALDVSANQRLVRLDISQNQIKTDAMSVLVMALTDLTDIDVVSWLRVMHCTGEGNEFNQGHLTITRSKQWVARRYNGTDWVAIADLTGDVNGDGQVDVMDVNEVIGKILTE